MTLSTQNFSYVYKGFGVCTIYIQNLAERKRQINSMVCIKKRNCDWRIFMDPKDLNKNIKREHDRITKREGITSEIAGGRYFTKLDASQGFWQLKQDESSKKYCTFNTPFGRYCFLRLPFGKISASEILSTSSRCWMEFKPMLMTSSSIYSEKKGYSRVCEGVLLVQVVHWRPRVFRR